MWLKDENTTHIKKKNVGVDMDAISFLFVVLVMDAKLHFLSYIAVFYLRCEHNSLMTSFFVGMHQIVVPMNLLMQCMLGKSAYREYFI